MADGQPRGAVAQMGERRNRTAEVKGSIPFGSTSALTTTLDARLAYAVGGKSFDQPGLLAAKFDGELSRILRVAFGKSCVRSEVQTGNQATRSSRPRFFVFRVDRVRGPDPVRW